SLDASWCRHQTSGSGTLVLPGRSAFFEPEELHLPVGEAGDNPGGALGRDRQACHWSLTWEDKQALATVQVPDADGTVLRPGDGLTRGRHRQRTHLVRMPFEDAAALAAVQVPDADGT